jgi:regulator of protease activity HflC (stomatin/prohibitin superfamily)
MKAENSGATQKSRILAWAIWLLGVAICMVTFDLLEQREHWAIIYLFFSAAALAFAFAAPTRHRALACSLTLVLLIALWTGRLFSALLIRAGILESSLAGHVGLTATTLWQLSLLAGSLTAILIAGTIILFASLFASEFMLLLDPQPGRTRKSTIMSLLRVAFHVPERCGVVENGQLISTKGMKSTERFTGPGQLRITNGHCVVLERDGKAARIEGPGIIDLRPLERCAKIVRLDPQTIPVTCENALTKDAISLKVKATLIMQIEPQERLIKRRQKADAPEAKAYSPFEHPLSASEIIAGDVGRHHKESIYRVAYMPPAQDIKDALSQAASRALQDAIARRRFDDLVDDSPGPAPTPLVQTIAQETKKMLDAETSCWGIEVTELHIDAFDPPAAVTEQIIGHWAQAVHGAMTEEELRTEARFIRFIRRFRAHDFWPTLQTTIQIASIVGHERRADGLDALANGLRQIAEKIRLDREAAIRLPEALRDLMP